ncbi:MAG: mechanosensitive ion channel domain-containing protein, partial [Myxococcota bacterium]
PFTHTPGAEAPPLLQIDAAIVMVLVAALVSWATKRLSAMPGLKTWRPWFFLGQLLLWGFVLLELVFAVSWAFTVYWLFLAVLILIILIVASVGWLRSVLAGLAMAFERRFQVGDQVRYNNVEGELMSFGMRVVSLKDSDGTVHEIPNERFMTEQVTNLESSGDSACEITVSLPEGVSPERARELARQAAFLTPLASPRHEPQIFLDIDEEQDSGLKLCIKGFAFASSHREHFRSDVVSRIHDMLRTESANRGR